MESKFIGIRDEDEASILMDKTYRKVIGFVIWDLLYK